MPTRKGKIARLPFDIRNDLNHRLTDNVPVKEIVIWLNTDSTVRVHLEELFEGRLITELDVAEWRQAGYQEWLTYGASLETVRALSEDAARVAITGINAEHFLLVLTATFADMLKNWGAMPEIAFNRKLIVFQDLTKLALDMRKSEQKDARLQIDRERLEILREKHRDKSPSSSSSRPSSFNSARPANAHPLDPKAAKIRRPPAPIDPNEWPNDPDWPPTPPVFYRSGPSPEEPMGTPDVTSASTGATPGEIGATEPNVETSNRLD